jgi:hypothetical protein
MQRAAAGVRFHDAGSEMSGRELQHPAVPQLSQDPPEAHVPCAPVLLTRFCARSFLT